MKGPILCTCLLLPLIASAADFPSRKAGLWEITMTMPAMNMVQTSKQCVDAATDAKMMEMGKNSQAQGGMRCTTSSPRKDGSGYVSETSCTGNGMTMNARSVFSGDFESSYSGETTTTFDPPVAGMSGQRMKMDARWVGPCEPGQAPGDIIMPGGVKMNINAQ